MTAVERLIATAEGEVGYLEKESNAQLDDPLANAGKNNWTKYARDLDALGFYVGSKNGYAWCDVFVDWCFVAAFGLETALALLCQPMPSYGAGCTSSANYYKKAGRFFPSGPRKGDQVFFTNDGGRTMDHTGIVVDVREGMIYTVEGNTSGASGVIVNGGGVCLKRYSAAYSRIGGYGRPDYALAGQTVTEEEVRALVRQEVGVQLEALAEKLDREIRERTEALRAELTPRVYHTVEELPWGQEAVIQLLKAGIIRGNESGDLYLTDTTLQVSVMLARLLALVEMEG